MREPLCFPHAIGSKRLLLRILDDGDALSVLDFQIKNAQTFEQFEPKRPGQFYTIKYQRALLSAEFNLFVKKEGCRFWVFQKEDPTAIIGTISFHFVTQFPFYSCQLGYKFDSGYWHQGYARESIANAIDFVGSCLNIHRIEAFVLPENLPSIRLLEKLNFYREGVAKECILMNGVWMDHLRYALILPDNDTNSRTAL